MEEMNPKLIKQKARIKTSKSSHRIKPRSNKNKDSKIVITKDEENNVYHIVSKNSLIEDSGNESKNKFKSRNLEFKRKKKRRKSSKTTSSGIKRKIKKIRQEHANDDKKLQNQEKAQLGERNPAQNFRDKNTNI